MLKRTYEESVFSEAKEAASSHWIAFSRSDFETLFMHQSRKALPILSDFVFFSILEIVIMGAY